MIQSRGRVAGGASVGREPLALQGVYGVGLLERERESGEREGRERERKTRGYEPCVLHAPRHQALLGNMITSPCVWGLVAFG